MDGGLEPKRLTRDDLRALSRRSDAAGLGRLCLHLLVIAATAAAITLAGRSWWLALALPAHGVALAFLFAPLHETIHRTAFESRLANAVVAWLCGLVLALPPTDFRYFHWAHHRHTQDPAHDPELAVPKPATRWQYALHLTGLPYWRERIAALWRQAAGRPGRPYLPARAHRRVILEARAFLAAYGAATLAALLSGSAVPLLYWVAPVMLGQPALRAFLLAEHTGCPEVPDMAVNTRTTLTGLPLRLLGWNMPYHAEHHLCPSVPFHALPHLHDRLVGRLARVSPGYRAAHREIRAALR